MKSMTCRELGGPCNKQFIADSWEQLVKVMTRHVMESHPDTARAMKQMHDEDPKKWSRETKPRWDAKPELRPA
jgi:predicted small metal-binding protein